MKHQNINHKSYIKYYPEEYIKELYERIVIDKYRMYNWIFNEVKKKEYMVDIEIDWKNNKIKYYSGHFKGSEIEWEKSMKEFISEFDL
jgi:hypothetical protein